MSQPASTSWISAWSRRNRSTSMSPCGRSGFPTNNSIAYPPAIHHGAVTPANFRTTSGGVSGSHGPGLIAAAYGNGLSNTTEFVDHGRMATRADMFVDLADDPRTNPPRMGDERATLMGFLRWQRESLELKCSGLDAEQLARRAVEPSTMSLLGLVRHMADVEHSWFHRFMSGEDVPHLFPGDIAFDDAVGDPAMVAEAWAVWREQ